MAQKRLAPRTHKSLVWNINKGLNQYSREVDLPDGYLWQADNVLPLSPNGLVTVKAPAVTVTGGLTVASALDLCRFHTTSTSYVVTRTASATAYNSTGTTMTTITNMPAASSSANHQMCVYRGKLIGTLAGSDAASWTADSATAVALTEAPEGGSCCDYKNRLFIAGEPATETHSRTMTIPCYVVGLPITTTGLSAVPATLDMGEQTINKQSGEFPVLVTNNAQASVKIITINIQGLDFRLTKLPTLPYLLPPGGSFTFSVAFNPESKGTKTGTVIIQTDSSTAESGGTWSCPSGSTVNISNKNWAANQWLGYTLRLYSSSVGSEAKEYKITGNGTSSITVEGTVTGSPGTKWEIRYNAEVKVSLEGVGLASGLAWQSPFVNFGHILKTNTPPDTLTIDTTLTNSLPDDITIAVPSGPSSPFTIQKYKLNDAAWVDNVWTGNLTLSPGKSLIVRFKLSGNVVEGVTTSDMTVVASYPGKPSRLYWSYLNDETQWNLEQDWIDFIDDVGYGGDIKALVSYNDAVWVFKESAIWALSGSGPTSFSKHEITLGRGAGICNAQSWCVVQGRLYWVNKQGVFEASGSSIRRISDALRPIVVAWTSTNHTAMRIAGYKDFIIFTDGSNGYCYHIPSEGWTRFPSFAPTAMAQENGAGFTGTMIYCSKTQGVIYRFDSTASTSAVDATYNHLAWVLKTGMQSMGNPNAVKLLRRVDVHCTDSRELSTLTLNTEHLSSSSTVTKIASRTGGSVADDLTSFIGGPTHIGTVMQLTLTGAGGSGTGGGVVIYGLVTHFNNISEMTNVSAAS